VSTISNFTTPVTVQLNRKMELQSNIRQQQQHQATSSNSSSNSSNNNRMSNRQGTGFVKNLDPNRNRNRYSLWLSKSLSLSISLSMAVDLQTAPQYGIMAICKLFFTLFFLQSGGRSFEFGIGDGTAHQVGVKTEQKR
jgi:hypothetical protein